MSTPRFHGSIRLVATRTAITCAGLFVVSTLMKWRVRTILHSAVVETEELATAAVNATGIPQERVYWTELTLWVPNRSSASCEVGIFVDQSAEPVVASEAKVGW